MPTIITLAGALVEQPMSLTRYRGELFQPPNTVVPLIYTNVPAKKNFDAAVDDLYDLVDEHVQNGPVTCVGHSMGGQVEGGLLRKLKALGVTPWPTDMVSFIQAGNPESEFGGYLRVPNSGGKFIYNTHGGPGIPDDTPYPVIDFKRQYDFFADHMDVLTNSLAKRNIGNMFSPIHSDYDDVGILDPNNLAYKKPGTKITYIVAPTHPLPMLKIFTWLDGIYRPRVEAAYRRPPYVKLSTLAEADPGDPAPVPRLATQMRTQCPGSGQPSSTRPQGRRAASSPATGTCPACERPVPVEARLFSWRVRTHYV